MNRSSSVDDDDADENDGDLVTWWLGELSCNQLRDELHKWLLIAPNLNPDDDIDYDDDDDEGDDDDDDIDDDDDDDCLH